MKPARILFIIIMSLAGAFIADLDAETVSNDSLVSLASHLTNLTRVTAKPVSMSSLVATFCTAGAIKSGHLALLPKTDAVMNVYVTTNGAAAMTNGNATFPLGAVILKQKFASMGVETPELYTGMLKREKGYNPDCGDWEFFTLGGDAKAVIARGKIESCMDCHKRYNKSDFVTRRYLL